ncbi:MAG: hypothetical protein U0414_30800 [Polyangiaceae bacterium]
MNVLPLLVALSLVPAAAPHVAAPLSGDACPMPTRIDAARVQASLNDLLAAEGLGATRAGVAIVRRVDLDGDATTLEALVDVISLEHCVGGACETLVVRVSSTGDLATAGHGKALGLLESRSGGWMDLSVNAFPAIPVGALRFSAALGRYR